MTRKKKIVEETAVEEPIALEEAASTSYLRASLEEIKDFEGVIGYIFRNSTSATIEFKDPSKLIEYTILSSSALEAAEQLSEVFSLGEVKNILVDGKEVRVLSLAVGDNKLSVFTEKKADLEKILRKLGQF